MSNSSPSPEARPELYESGVTIPSDSENYEGNNELSSSPPESSNAPMILYSPPTIWGLLRGAAINLILPFINGLMLGFGELLAHEVAFRWGWSGTKVRNMQDSNSQQPLTYRTADISNTPKRFEKSRARRGGQRRSYRATSEGWYRAGHVHKFGMSDGQDHLWEKNNRRHRRVLLRSLRQMCDTIAIAVRT